MSDGGRKLPVHGRLHHVATVVRDLDAAVRFHREVLRLPLEQIADVPSQEVRIAFLTAGDRKSTRLNSSHIPLSRMPSSA